MSSDHVILVARNTETDEIELPMGDMMLYDVEAGKSVLQQARTMYGPEWVISIYKPVGDSFIGTGARRRVQ